MVARLGVAAGWLGAALILAALGYLAVLRDFTLAPRVLLAAGAVLLVF
ncbi:MAG: hypothetical protein HY691_14390, partial [Chloroflexi bacterium]|nr:hypothetical protein [Chloroflexota bacterium]